MKPMNHHILLCYLTSLQWEADRKSLGSLMTTTSAPQEPQPCPWTRCFALFLSVCWFWWLVRAASGLTDIHSWATSEWVIDVDRKKKKEKQKRKFFLWLLVIQIILSPLCYINIEDSFKDVQLKSSDPATYLMKQNRLFPSPAARHHQHNALTNSFYLFSNFTYALTSRAML